MEMLMSTSEIFSPDHSKLINELGNERLREWVLRMQIIRAFEEKAEELFARGLVHGTMHLSIGQEAVAIGASAAMKPGDYLLNHHRGHGHCLAWGSDVRLMMAEFLGKETGYCRGRGGSMHIANVEMNNLGANGIVGGGIPISVGVGLSIKKRRSSQVCLTIFGDGAVNTGAFHESLNMASIWNLPVVYLCENNQYAMSMPIQKACRLNHLSQRAAAYAIAGITVDGNDALAVYEAVRQAVARARSGYGPTLVEAITYRWKGHSKSDRQAYRSRDEVKDWQSRDPIMRLARLIQMSDAEFKAIVDQARTMIEEAVEFAQASPEPDPDTIFEGLYA
ncbi:MAG TPA: thiamine pyrophosphate-dependent dehydrogenase E1 component subunit alpha [Chloroflexus aurantiacus]|jgi:pyruvate dehydrogenase E1 component alpha subunit|uniref:Pyruvate dehydrogenase (Acetyl-transferring) n=1 Tax=Chloroflexus aurantiacus (strain ATCC 29366 / DSM 635 / J-10-fl) TaxID=324602 RepID=A9W9S7_CHLAA|nr:thiamine pyrophosphate-dependent dehydrogenase E1 component subunit alpha [Chloroflexus aurantiacus]ABY34563.1 Pyruvate dehydrogenase (acetyl-transferring) [Chloroflexus aurantiacus J-10-fl]RMG01878.1 MAG: thiamine pyrophosphate-dependent dehydrogenase E1 component subunit alpha [Acidobacteriota bacterium]GIV93938.1 MAG: acetoin:2,6-dichlorophenolindophenol oxidoreductase subunit alpha [Chloroflexus sp.]HBW66854.1 thiamine pyrophosphate-dependent dehydrogenase E1 component subunit alpha [Chl